MVRVQIKGGVWKNTEDEILKAAISKYGMNQWARISSLLVRKTPKQCKARWYEWLDPSIKKTEWSKEEDEKLLHLAKLMPTQWRTIAPIVGRTATQCLERYQKLLDEAEEQDREAGPSKLGLTGVAGPEAGPSADDVRRLRPGEIDPDPESKPARPDPIDMDEDEKEMLSEARARLANTQGKKAKRKARERALEEAKRLAVLQKRRELKAAGIVMRGPKPKKNQMDYNADIPFEKQPAKGFYDTSEEASKSYQAPVGQTLGGKRKPGDDEGPKKKDRDDKKKDPFGERAEQMRKLKEAEQITKRRKLMLPDAQVGERELEEIVKLGQASESARDLVAGDEVTDGLLGTYDPLERAKMARTPRTAPEDDAVMREARNLRNMTAAQTPLLGDLNTPMEEGLGNAGAKPRSSVVQTPNPLLTPATHRGQAPGETPMSSRGGMMAATPRSTVGGASYAVDGTPMRTPMRDNLGLNDDAMSAVSATPFDEKRARFSAKQELQHGLGSLPAPKNDFELVLDEEEDDDDDYEDMITISEDAADRDARMAQSREEERQRALARRSRAVQLDLPRPANVDPAAMLASLRVSEAPPAEQLVLREMVQLMKHDSIVHPIAGSKAVGGLRSDLPVLADAALDGAREAIRSEMATTLGFPGAKGEVLQRLVASRLEPEEDGSASEDAVALDSFMRAQEEKRAWSASLRRWVARASLSDAEYRAGQAALLELARGQMAEAATAASKEERRLGKLLGGYQSRSKTLAASIREAAGKLAEAGVEQASFERLAEGEEGAIKERVAKLEEEVRALERREEIGQHRYKELDDRRRLLREQVRAMKEERDMREAERLNEAALAQADEADEAEEAEVEVIEAAEAPAVEADGA